MCCTNLHIEIDVAVCDLCSGDDKRRLPPKTVFVQVKRCPACRYPIEKNGGCPHMTCSRCRAEFCWLCRADWKGHNYSRCRHAPEIVSVKLHLVHKGTDGRTDRRRESSLLHFSLKMHQILLAVILMIFLIIN